MTGPKMLLSTVLLSGLVVGFTFAADIPETDSPDTFVYEQYMKKGNELEQYNNLLDLLKSEGLKEEATLDSALLMLVRKKIELLESEYGTYSQQLLSLPLPDLFNKFLPEVVYNLSKIDVSRVKQAWLDRVNAMRAEIGLYGFEYNKVLDHSAQEWAEELALKYGSSKSVGGMETHQRDNQSVPGYHHKTLGTWFADRGIYTVVVAGSNYTENTGYGMYSCKKDDCTDSMSRAIMSTFNFYMSEKRYGGPHYRSLVSNNFKYIGFGLACVNSANGGTLTSCDKGDTQSGRYWLVIHYATDFKPIEDTASLKNEWYGEYIPM